MGEHPKILLFDIENTPNLSWTWGIYEQNVIKVVKQWYILCWSAKWYGKKQTIVRALPDYGSYKKDKTDDKELITELWKLFNEADIIIGHNGDKFDIKKTNTRMIIHGLKPPEPYKTIDTLKEARRYFGFTSNKLDELGKQLGVGEKEKHTGFKLWEDCMNGDMKAWRMMKRYNKKDVTLLEDIYIKLRPWMQHHPNVSIYGEVDGCPKCGSKRLTRQGFNITRTGKRQQFKCLDCGGWCSGKHQKLVDIR